MSAAQDTSATQDTSTTNPRSGGQTGDGSRRIAALGEGERLRGFAFAGVTVAAAEDADAVRSAWRSLAPDVGLVILTRAAYETLARELADEPATEQGERLWVVMPA